MKSPLLRVTLFLIGYWLITFAAAIPKGMAPRPLADLVWGVIASIAILALTLVMLKREHRTSRDVGMAPDARTATRLVAGVTLGLAVYAATVVVVSLSLGPIHLSEPTPPSAATWLRVIATFFALSCMEELGFRAYALRTLILALGTWKAQASIAVVFGLSHLATGWPLVTVLLGVVPSALLFGALAARSGGLAMPIGAHAAINIAYWMVGAKETPGVWTLNADPLHTSRVSSGAPIIGMVVTLAAALMVARWPANKQPNALTEALPTS